jgi:5,5'-dehydrodivanillate O-demethylase
VLAQDAIVWVAQGAIVDRSQEKLGRTDVPIVLLRRQLDEQIGMVEQGKAPMNFFPGKSPDVLHGSGKPPDDWTAPDWAKRRLSIGQNYRQKYHKGFAIDDVDRYGPAVPLVQDLHRRIEEAEIKALEEA